VSKETSVKHRNIATEIRYPSRNHAFKVLQRSILLFSRPY